MKNTKKFTEQQNPNTLDVDNMNVLDIIRQINKEDKTVITAISKILNNLECLIEDVILKLQSGGRLFYIGSGTSGRLGILDAVECPPTFSTEPSMVQGIIAGGSAALLRSIEGAEDNIDAGESIIRENIINENDIVIGISASSTTPFVLGALQESKKLGATTGLIVCNKSPDITFIDHIIRAITGPEVITGSTRMKAGTATKMILNIISTTTMIKLNKTYGNLMVDLKAMNKKLWDRASRIITQITGIDYNDAMDYLKLANGEVKPAVVMIKKGCDYEDSLILLKKVNGNLRLIIENKIE